MADSIIEKEDIALLKPIGMTCIHDKRYQCGSFDSWEEFQKYDGEKFCNRMCLGRTGGKSTHNKRARDVNEGLAARQATAGNKFYAHALQNSVNSGLIPKRRYEAYLEEVGLKRRDGRRRLIELGR